MLNCKPLKVAAEGNSASETIWGMIDVQTGALIANPKMPVEDILAGSTFLKSRRIPELFWE
jgi:hypothetical protein